MDLLTTTAAAGMRSRLESLDLLANNLSNLSAPGFKADGESFTLYLSAESAAAQTDGEGVAQTLSPLIENRWTDTSQGELHATGVPSDLALSGSGYVQVKGPNGPLFTRDGRFSVNSTGKLMTAGGYEFASESGQPFQLNPALAVTVDADGTVRQDNVAMGRLKLVDWPSGTPAAKRQAGYFQLDSDSLAQLEPSTAELRQGYQEQANLNAAQASVRLIDVMRQFEALDKAAQLGSEMSKQTLSDVARVTA